MKYTRLCECPIGKYKLHIGAHVQDLEITNNNVIVDGVKLSTLQIDNLERIEKHEDVLYVPISET